MKILDHKNSNKIFRLTSVLGNYQSLDGGAMFGNVPKSMWQKWIEPDSQNRIKLQCRAMLVDIAGIKILCEVGIGAFFDPSLRDRYGVADHRHVLIDELAKLGLQESDIDFVVLSHLHFDHAGGLLPSWEESQGKHVRLMFPRARYVVGKTAFERAKNPHARDRASFIPELQELLANSNRLLLIDEERHPDFFPDCVRFSFTDGHTPGHMHIEITGNQKTIFFAGDLIPGTAWVHLPITMGYDRFAEKVIDEKNNFYKRWANHPNNWVYYTHDQNVALSKISKNEKGRFEAIEAIETPVGWEF